MDRSRILGAGVWTAIGLGAAFAVVSANSNHHRATAANTCSTRAAVASAHDCCTPDAKAAPAVAAVTRAAARPSTRKLETLARAPRPSVGMAGLVIAVDPESGELGMPSADQIAELKRNESSTEAGMVSQMDAGLTPVTHADGSVSVDLQGRFQEFATVRVLPNGKHVFGCVSNPKVELPTSIPAPAALEEK